MDMDRRTAPQAQESRHSNAGRRKRGVDGAAAPAGPFTVELRPPPLPNRRILVAEDARDLALLLAQHLGQLARDVCVCADGRAALDQVRRDPVDLIVLDAVLPGIGGLEVCRSLRESSIYTPVLVLSGGGSELDRILGLELGADDYLMKPFSMLEVLARAKALLRRAEYIDHARANNPGQMIRAGDLVIDPACRSVERAGRTVDLTEKEFDLLLLFASHPGRVYSRSQLLHLVWGHGIAVFESAVTTHINRLRSKIEAVPGEPAHILTVWGVGYRLQAEKIQLPPGVPDCAR